LLSNWYQTAQIRPFLYCLFGTRQLKSDPFYAGFAKGSLHVLIAGLISVYRSNCLGWHPVAALAVDTYMFVV